MVDASTAAEVIAHLTPRGNSVRRIFGGGATKLLMGVSEIFSDKDAVVSMLGLGEPAPNRIWNERIASAFDEEPKLAQAIDFVLKQTKIPKTSLDRALFMCGKEYMLGSTSPVPGQFQQVFSDLLDRIDDVVSDPGLVKLYGDLSESAHPNYEGICIGYSKVDHNDHVINFANRWTEMYGDTHLNGMHACMMLFEAEYNEVWPAHFDDLERCVEANEAELEAGKAATPQYQQTER